MCLIRCARLPSESRTCRTPPGRAGKRKRVHSAERHALLQVTTTTPPLLPSPPPGHTVGRARCRQGGFPCELRPGRTMPPSPYLDAPCGPGRCPPRSGPMWRPTRTGRAGDLIGHVALRREAAGLYRTTRNWGVPRGPHAASAGAPLPSCRRHAASELWGRHPGSVRSDPRWHSGANLGAWAGVTRATRRQGGSLRAPRPIRPAPVVASAGRFVTQAGTAERDRRERSGASRGTATVRLCNAGVCGADGPGASRRGRKARINSGSDVARPTRPVASRAYRSHETGGVATRSADGLQGSIGLGSSAESRAAARCRPVHLHPTPESRPGAGSVTRSTRPSRGPSAGSSIYTPQAGKDSQVRAPLLAGGPGAGPGACCRTKGLSRTSSRRAIRVQGGGHA